MHTLSNKDVRPIMWARKKNHVFIKAHKIITGKIKAAFCELESYFLVAATFLLQLVWQANRLDRLQLLHAYL
jgi:hypothetical protein